MRAQHHVWPLGVGLASVVLGSSPACAEKGRAPESEPTRGIASTVASVPNDIARTRVAVVVEAPGFSADAVEIDVLIPLEEALAALSGVANLRGTAVEGRVEVWAEFNPDTTPSAALEAVRDAMKSVTSLPADVDQPVVSLVGRTSRVLWTGPAGADASSVRDRIRTAPGVVAAEACAVSTVLEIRVDPSRLAAMGLLAEDVRAALASTAVEIPGGRIDVADAGLLVRTGGSEPEPAPRDSWDVWKHRLVRAEPPIRLADVADATLAESDDGCRCFTRGAATCVEVELAEGTDGIDGIDDLGGIDDAKVWASVPTSLVVRAPDLREPGRIRRCLDAAAPTLPTVVFVRRDRIRIDTQRLPVGELSNLANAVRSCLPGSSVEVVAAEGLRAHAFVVAARERSELARRVSLMTAALTNSGRHAWSVEGGGLAASPELSIRPDPEKLAALGVSRSELARALRGELSGSHELAAGVRLVVGESERGRSDLEDVAQLPLRTRAGTVQVRDVASIELDVVPGTFTHVDRQRAATLTVFVDPADDEWAAVEEQLLSSGARPVVSSHG